MAEELDNIRDRYDDYYDEEPEVLENDDYEEESEYLGGDDEYEDFSEIELEAMKHGWKPEDEFEDPNKRWVSAEEFMDRKSLFDQIHSLKKKTKEQDKVVEALKEHNATISDRMYKRAMEELKNQRREAIEYGEADKVENLDEEMNNLKKEYDEQKAVTETEDPFTSYYNEWIEDNQWYLEDEDKKEFADFVGVQYVRNNPEASPEEVYAHVNERVAKQFSTKQGSEESEEEEEDMAEKRKRNPNVARATQGRKARNPDKGNKYKLTDLPEEDQSIAKTLIRTGTITEEDYLKQYFGE